VVNARFAMHEQAERCIAALKLRERPADFSYNTTSYDREHGIPYSGWCTLEQGVCLTSCAYVAEAEREAAATSAELPERLARAQASRPKAVDISACVADGGAAVPREAPPSSEKLLQETLDAIDGATFVGKGDGEKVQQMLNELVWVLRAAVEQSTMNHAESDLTIDPAFERARPGVEHGGLAGGRAYLLVPSAGFSTVATTEVAPGLAVTRAAQTGGYGRLEEGVDA